MDRQAGTVGGGKLQAPNVEAREQMKASVCGREGHRPHLAARCLVGLARPTACRLRPSAATLYEALGSSAGIRAQPHHVAPRTRAAARSTTLCIPVVRRGPPRHLLDR